MVFTMWMNFHPLLKRRYRVYDGDGSFEVSLSKYSDPPDAFVRTDVFKLDGENFKCSHCRLIEQVSQCTISCVNGCLPDTNEFLAGVEVRLDNSRSRIAGMDVTNEVLF